jgi:hypothetical protein
MHALVKGKQAEQLLPQGEQYTWFLDSSTN